MYSLDKCASRSAKNPVTFLDISALVMVFKISNSAANKDSVITTLSRERFFSIGKPRIKLSDEGIGTNEIMLKPREVTTAINSNPSKSNIEMKN
jgi:hypothetical protein